MRIVIELPSWAEERNIFIFAGIELLAQKLANEETVRQKVSRCNWCGKCCQRLSGAHPFPTVDNVCVHLKREPGLEEKYLCGLAINRPLGCSLGEPGGADCSITYEVRDLESNLLQMPKNL